MSTVTAPGKGLEGIIAANSGVCWIDGDKGILSYRGIDIHELAQKSCFEETSYLLWFGKLPTRSQLEDFQLRLAAARVLAPQIVDLIRSFPKSATPMEVLRTSVSALSMFDPKQSAVDHESNVVKAYALTSQIAMIVATFDRLRKGKQLVAPDRSLSHAANFLYMLTGEKPSETAAKTFDVALVLHADHELNASTFAARVTASTLSDMHSAITSAIGALKGPLHGGANEAVMSLLLAIEKAGVDPVQHVAGMLAQKAKVPGFGHRVYTTEDPRATHLRRMSEQLSQSSDKGRYFQMSKRIEEYVNREKRLNANVDFYSASAYTMLGLDVDLFTPIFAASRISGWVAHVIEQLDDNRLIRPRAEYIGPAYPNPYISIEQR